MAADGRALRAGSVAGGRRWLARGADSSWREQAGSQEEPRRDVHGIRAIVEVLVAGRGGAGWVSPVTRSRRILALGHPSILPSRAAKESRSSIHGPCVRAVVAAPLFGVQRSRYP